MAEDECGEDYFRMFQALNIEAWNPGHASIAALAAAGVVRAVLPNEAEAVDALPTPDPDTKGAIYSLGRSETLEKFHSHVLPLSGEKA